MRLSTLLGTVLISILISCTGRPTQIEKIREVPLKTIKIPTEETGMHRAQAEFLLYGAVSVKEQKARLGQYYFVTWHDSDPSVPVSLVMQYRQAKTGSQILTKTINYPARRTEGEKHAEFKFIGEEAKEKGAVLSWKLMLKDQHDRILSEKHSYLWKDDN
jgi:hypothetical protein